MTRGVSTPVVCTGAVLRSCSSVRSEHQGPNVKNQGPRAQDGPDQCVGQLLGARVGRRTAAEIAKAHFEAWPPAHPIRSSGNGRPSIISRKMNDQPAGDNATALWLSKAPSLPAANRDSSSGCAAPRPFRGTTR
jgi:hypothetical protein